MLMLQFTGLSGAGKTTIAHSLQAGLSLRGIEVELIDGDFYRKTVCSDLGYSRSDRIENVRRLAAIGAKSKAQVVIIAAINPFEEVRLELKNKYNAQLVWLDCDIDTLLRRDTKGLYRRALLPADDPAKVYNLTGLNDPFDIPSNPDLVLKTAEKTPDECTRELIAFIENNI